MKVKAFKLLILVITISLSLAQGHATAQVGYGTFRGVIVDVKGKRIRGAAVSISGEDFKRELKPTRDGYFEIDLPVGKYEITVTKSGYATYILKNLVVGPKQDLSNVFRLIAKNPQSVVASNIATFRQK